MHIKFLTFILLAFLFGANTVNAQRRRPIARKPQPVVILTPEEEAEQAQAIALRERKEEMLPMTRRVTFIDSLVCDKDAFLEHLRLTSDAGRFVSARSLFNHRDAEGVPVLGEAAFISPLGNRVLFAAAETPYSMSLYDAYRTENGWTRPTPLQGVGTNPNCDYPFLLTDGVTLYFAATGEESLGGYDIFVSRYNTTSHTFCEAENVGFPFNSEANDYLLAIDEAIGVGVLATDRRQPDDKVCLYWFLYDATYNTYDLDIDDENERVELERYAALESIAATVKSTDVAETTRHRWLAALSETAEATDDGVLRFVVDDRHVITHLSQFRSAEARDLARHWMQETKLLKNLTKEQTALRREYAESASRRTAQRLLNLESQIPQLHQSIDVLARQCRAAELNVNR